MSSPCTLALPLVAALLLQLPTVASAQYKCTAADGSVSFQQTACAGVQKQQALTIKPAMGGDPPPAQDGTKPGAGGTVEQRMMRGIERDRRVRDIEQNVINTEAAINIRNSTMSAELAALQNRKQSARNNLAGATYEQSVSAEMQAIAAKYRTMNDVDLERLKQLRADLATARQQPGAR